MTGLFAAMASGLRRPETKAADVSGLTWASLFGQPNAKSGVAVNVDTALKVSTVLGCLRALADGVA